MSNPQNNFQITGSTGISVSEVHQVMTTGEAAEPEPRRESVVKVLFLGANPSGTDQLRLDREVKAIADVLKVAKAASRFQLEQSWAVTVHDMQDGLLRHEPDIVHLSGHGRSDGLLVLEPDSVTPDLHGASPSNRSYLPSLGKLFASAKGRIRCVVLNACHSAEAARVIAEHVDCVIGMSNSVEDDAAIQFSRGFYHALGQGQSVRTAFEIGVAQIGLSGANGAEVPILLGRAAPEAVSFAQPKVGTSPR
jgi:CHAT domain-containing protein